MFHVTLSGLVKMFYNGDQAPSLISQMGNPAPGSMGNKQLARLVFTREVTRLALATSSWVLVVSPSLIYLFFFLNLYG